MHSCCKSGSLVYKGFHYVVMHSMCTIISHCRTKCKKDKEASDTRALELQGQMASCQSLVQTLRVQVQARDQ